MRFTERAIMSCPQTLVTSERSNVNTNTFAARRQRCTGKRWNTISTDHGHLSIAWMVCMVMAVVLSVIPRTSLADPSANVKDISTFVQCVNNEGKAGRIKNIADTVRCIPKQCTITLTMNTQSSQMACTLGGCQLPRVILTCPGPADDKKLRPSYLLCPIGSVPARPGTGGAGIIGINRVEVAEDLTKVDLDRRPPTGSLKGSDIEIPPGQAFKDIDIEKVHNKVLNPPLLTDGTQGCNTCHKNVFPRPPMAGQVEPIPPINPFGEALGGREGLPFIIHTDEKDKNNKPKNDMLNPGPGLKKQTLAQICDCIKTNRAKIKAEAMGDSTFKEENLDVMSKLCDALKTYQERRGICGTDNAKPMPDPPGLVCASARGGGKFLIDGAVSMLRLDLSGSASLDELSTSFNAIQIGGTLASYDYLTRTQIQSVLFSSLQGTLFSGGDFILTGEGIALVNGVRANIKFNATKTGGVAAFDVTDADTGMFLGGGTGEEFGRSALELLLREP